MKKVLIFLMFFSPAIIFSQNYEIGLLAGTSFYSGDLSPEKISNYPKTFRLAGGLWGRIYLNSKMALRLGVNIGSIEGSDENRDNTSRNLNFQSSLVEVGLLGEIQTFKLKYSKAHHLGISNYLFAGMALYHFNPKAEFNGNLIELAPLGTEGQGIPGYPQPYGLSQFSIPFGLGFKIDLSNQWAIGIEFGARKLFTDYLDDVGSAEIDYQTLRRVKGDLATQLSIPEVGLTDEVFSYRRGGERLDWYYITGFSIMYKFGNGYYAGGKFGKHQLGCPKL